MMNSWYSSAIIGCMLAKFLGSTVGKIRYDGVPSVDFCWGGGWLGEGDGWWEGDGWDPHNGVLSIDTLLFSTMINLF